MEIPVFQQLEVSLASFVTEEYKTYATLEYQLVPL